MARLRQRAARPKAEIRHHLIIARPPGVQPPARIADQLFQPRFNMHVNVFKLDAKGQLRALQLTPHGF